MRPETTAVILTEAGPETGYGHLARCVALAEALQRCQARVRIVVRGEAPASLHATHDVLAAEWLDPGSLLVAVGGADIAVVDSYRAPLEVYAHVAANVETAVWFDDAARLEYPPGFVVNGSPAARASDYPGFSNRSLLIGPVYQCLRSAFWDIPERTVRRQLCRALVVFGGTDVHRLAPKVAAQMNQVHPDLELDVVESVRSAEEMRDAMLGADIALSAGGQTLYELARTGTPTVCVWVAEHQRAQVLAFEQAGILVVAGAWQDEDTVKHAVRMVDSLASPSTRGDMARAGRGLVDGQGASRVAVTAVRSLSGGRRQ